MEKWTSRSQGTFYTNSNPDESYFSSSSFFTFWFLIWWCKSLCNACGIRQMKARRAIAVASAKATSCMIVRKEKKCDVGYSVPYKKRYKFSHDGDANLQNMGFKDPLIDLNSTSAAAFHPSFPQDDKDAAILLMTLSCGVING
ncbi:hypothetical protein HPP92_008927 [Vanilla planifolia]|uniref:Uncharacterized protein n=1 Tax=Vanilla planifolia TaxID=51239 RepID=A0A835V650_VANPL|nr:hypothetical protein HPP92_008927 [Vanilla planifolia]